MTPAHRPTDGHHQVTIEELARRIEAGKLTMPQLFKKLTEAGASTERSAALMAKVLLEMVKHKSLADVL